jgi:hypothetical protein
MNRKEMDVSPGNLDEKGARKLERRREARRKRIAQLVKEINETYLKFELYGRRTVESALKLGGLFLDLQKDIRKAGRKWMEYFAETFANIDIRTMQRCMRLAKRFDLEETPSLVVLNQTKLHELDHAAGEVPILKFLEEHNLPTKVDTEDGQEVNELRDNIESAIEKARKTSKKKSSGIKILLLGLLNSNSARLEQLKKIRNDKKQLREGDPAGFDRAIETLTEICEVLKRMRKKVMKLSNK